MHYQPAPSEAVMKLIRDQVEDREWQQPGATWATAVAFYAAIASFKGLAADIMLERPEEGVIVMNIITLLEQMVEAVKHDEYHTQQRKYGPEAEQI